MAVARYYDHDLGEWVLLAVGRDGASGASSWDDLTDKPATFPPESHTHTPASIGAAPASHDHTAAQISDATTVGRNVLTASSQANARTAIGAGTSSLSLGTTSSTAAAGDHTHSQYATTTTVNSVSSRVTTLENAKPIIVSSLPSSPLSGRIYLVTG